MDVISEIKAFENHPDRVHFSALQLSDFYKKLSDRSLTFEAIISSLHRGTGNDCIIHADTYSYTIQHNPVTGRDYLNWAPDLSFICEANKNDFPFNPLTDLIKGDKIRSGATFISWDAQGIHVKLHSIEKISYLEIEKEKEALEKKFNEEHKEKNVLAPQRQFRNDTFQRTLTFLSLGGLIGGLIGLFWGAMDIILDSSNSLLMPGIEGVFTGGALFGLVAVIISVLQPKAKI